jgi:outer membrane protein assembly factor BamB
LANGAVVWSNDLRITYGGEVISWQNAASPLVDGGLIYLNVNAGGANLMALRTSDGNLFWRSQDENLTHSTPVLTTMNGVRQLIFATQSGLVSFKSTDWESALANQLSVRLQYITGSITHCLQQPRIRHGLLQSGLGSL